jgi:hypothetical protein
MMGLTQATRWAAGAALAVFSFATPAGAANPTLGIVVDFASVYQDATRFSVVCTLHQDQSNATGSAHGIQFLRDLVNGNYVGRWQNGLNIAIVERGPFDFNKASGTYACKATLDDGSSAGTQIAAINGAFPLPYGSELGQMVYRGRPRLPAPLSGYKSFLKPDGLH